MKTSKRYRALKYIVGHQLSSLYKTRFVDRHDDGVIQFPDCLPKITESLEFLPKWKNSTTASKANSLLLTFRITPFIVSLICLSDVSPCTQQWSHYFRKTQIDLNFAKNMLNDTLNILKRKREKNFAALFLEITDIAKGINVEL